MAFLSKYERASTELRKVPARRSGDGLTPAHTAAAAGLAGDGDERDVECDVEPDAECAPESVKVYRDAYQVPAEYPEPIRISPEDFRRGPVRAGHEAPSPGDCA